MQGAVRRRRNQQGGIRLTDWFVREMIGSWSKREAESGLSSQIESVNTARTEATLRLSLRRFVRDARRASCTGELVREL